MPEFLIQYLFKTNIIIIENVFACASFYVGCKTSYAQMSSFLIVRIDSIGFECSHTRILFPPPN